MRPEHIIQFTTTVRCPPDPGPGGEAGGDARKRGRGRKHMKSPVPFGHADIQWHVYANTTCRTSLSARSHPNAPQPYTLCRAACSSLTRHVPGPLLVVLLLFVPLVPWALGVGGDQGRPGEVARAVPSPNAGPQHRASPCLWLTTAVAAPRARGCWGSSLRLGRGMLGRSAGGVAFEPYMVSSCLERVTSISSGPPIYVESDRDGRK